MYKATSKIHGIYTSRGFPAGFGMFPGSVGNSREVGIGVVPFMRNLVQIPGPHVGCWE